VFDKLVIKARGIVGQMTDWRWLGRELRHRRQELGKSGQWVAERAGLSVQNIYAIEQGRSVPPLRTLSAIAEVLGLELLVSLRDPGRRTRRVVLDVSELDPEVRDAVSLLIDELSDRD